MAEAVRGGVPDEPDARIDGDALRHLIGGGIAAAVVDHDQLVVDLLPSEALAQRIQGQLAATASN